jgi:hypothetical protein
MVASSAGKREYGVNEDETSTVEPRFTNAPVHEQFCSRTNFPIKNVSDDEQRLGLRTRKLATAAS